MIKKISGDSPRIPKSINSLIKMVQEEVNLEPVAWTLLGSFVNTDGTVSWGGSRNGNWTNSRNFGAAENCTVADFKSEAWSEVPGRELMIEDRLV